MLKPSRILLGISAGIAAYKTPALIRLLRKQGAEVRVVLTPRAQGFVGHEALRTVSENPVSTDSSDSLPFVYSENLQHVRLAQWAEVLLIAPATANTIAKLAAGIADNLLTTLALCFKPGSMIVAPAMNEAMWRNPATAENIARLQARGVLVLPVGEGELACGDAGPGRMLDIEDIAAAVRTCLLPRALAGRRVVISSGPTLEPIDPVRAITNRSSGKMGAALARAAWALGGEVIVISGPARQPLPQGVKSVFVTTAQEMLEALDREFDAADFLIMAAAVADFRPAAVASEKLSRRASQRLMVELAANPDILQSLTKRKARQFIVGFALETAGCGEESARRKMREKRCDMMVLNHPAQSLELDQAAVTLLEPGERCVKLGPMPKEDIALELMLRMARQQSGAV